MVPDPHDVLRKLTLAAAQEQRAVHAFFGAWKRGVAVAGIALFGHGSRAGFDAARDKWDLCPNVPLIQKVISPMSSGEKVFLAAMVSFYDAHDGGLLLRRAGVEGLSDLGILDAQRRDIIASLLLHYHGW